MEATSTLGEFVTRHGQIRGLAVGQSVFREGDASDAVYTCVSGRINVFITTPKGRDLILGSKTPGQAFGELSAIDGGPRSSSAVAVVASVVAHLPADRFLWEVARLPLLSLNVMRELTDQVRRNNARVSAWSSQSTTERVGHVLVDLAANYHRHGRLSDPTDLPITQDEVAAWVGASREATSRALTSLRRTGAIRTARHKIVVIDSALLLRVLAACGSQPN